jgi:hypothetical protein
MSIAFIRALEIRQLRKRERGMYEEFAIVEMGDAAVETRQIAPGAVPDSAWGFGRA